MESGIHIAAIRNKVVDLGNQGIQTFIQTKPIEQHRLQEQFNSELCRMLLEIGDPSNKVNNPSFKRFIEFWTKMKVPEESNLRKVV